MCVLADTGKETLGDRSHHQLIQKSKLGPPKLVVNVGMEKTDSVLSVT